MNKHAISEKDLKEFAYHSHRVIEISRKLYNWNQLNRRYWKGWKELRVNRKEATETDN